ncbi:MAG: glycosyltransferase family A protein [Patescibacteria group bacterium]
MSETYVPGLISVVIPTYQHADTIAACIESTLAQTYDFIEIIVVDDGSTDNTQEVLKQYKEKLKMIYQENQGPNFARNRGFEEARGEFVIFCDADVIMKPSMLKRMVDTLREYPEVSYVYSAFTFGWKLFRGVSFSERQLKKHNFIHTTTLVRRLDFPGFDINIKRFQDWDVWLTMLTDGKIGRLIPDVLFHVQIEGDSRIGSQWLPSFMYKIPWDRLPWRPGAIKKYQSARSAIAAKHGL